MCLVVIIVGIVKINSLNKEVKIHEQQENKSDQIDIDLNEMRDNYQQEASSILREYLADNERAYDNFVDREEQTKQAIDKIMDLTLTKEFKGLHLKLIIALNSIQEGYEMMQTQPTEDVKNQIGQGFVEIDQLSVEYPWLKN